MSRTIDSIAPVRRRGVLVLLLVFVSGGLGGAAVTRALASRATPPPAAPQASPQQYLERGVAVTIPSEYDVLGLTDAQRTQITAILTRRKPVADSLLRAVLPGLRQWSAEARTEIDAALDSAQRGRLKQTRDSLTQQLIQRVQNDARAGRIKFTPNPAGGDSERRAH